MKNKINSRKTKKKALIAGVALAAIMIGGTLAAVLPFGSNNSSSNSSRNEQNPNEVMRKLYNPVVQNASALGSSSAKITMIEFAGYQCQSCAKFHRETMDDILKNFVNTGKVRYLFKDFVISSESPATTTAANRNIVGISDPEQFSNCLASHKYSKVVNENTNLARSIGLQSIPTFILLSNRTQPL